MSMSAESLGVSARGRVLGAPDMYGLAQRHRRRDRVAHIFKEHEFEARNALFYHLRSWAA